MQVSQLREKIKQNDMGGVYLFCGEEDYLKRHYLSEMRSAVITDEALAPFSHFSFEGAQIDFSALSDALCTPSFMADGKFIEWHLADFNALKEKDLEALALLCETAKQDPSQCLVFVCTAEGFDPGTERRPSKLFTRLEKLLAVVPFFRSTDAQLVGWIKRHFAAEKIGISATLPQAMLLQVGHSMDILAQEINKLICYAKANGLSTVSEREMAYICVRTVEMDAFSLSNAILDGKTEEAFRYLGDMKRRRIEPILVLGQISRLFHDMLTVAMLSEENMTPKEIAQKTKMHEYKVGLYAKSARKNGIAAITRALHLCGEIDAVMKNGTSSYIGIERFIASFAKTQV